MRQWKSNSYPNPIQTPASNRSKVVTIMNQRLTNIDSWTHSLSRRFSIPLSNQLPNNEILLQEPLLPRLQILQLILIQILKIIQRTRQILRQHLLVETLECQPARCIAAGEVLVRTALSHRSRTISRASLPMRTGRIRVPGRRSSFRE